MKNVWAWVAGIVVGASILGLLLVGQAARQHQRAAYVVIRGTTEQRAEAKTPPGRWLLVRRIPRPQN